MVNFFTLAMSLLMFCYSFCVIYRMNSKTNHLRRAAWVIISSGSFGIVLCALSGDDPKDYYAITFAGVVLLTICGVRGISEVSTNIR